MRHRKDFAARTFGANTPRNRYPCPFCGVVGAHWFLPRRSGLRALTYCPSCLGSYVHEYVGSRRIFKIIKG